MKYKDFKSEDARKECKKHAYRKAPKSILITKCEECPLRRERTDEKGRTIGLVCYWRLQDIVCDLIDEWEELQNEEIKHIDEYRSNNA